VGQDTFFNNCHCIDHIESRPKLNGHYNHMGMHQEVVGVVEAGVEVTKMLFLRP
jgi:hypothetical protein